MQDMLTSILKYIPAFLDEFIALVSGPKRFIARKNSQSIDNNFVNALAFLGISMILLFLLRAPLFHEDAFIPNVVSAIVSALLIVVIYSAVFRLSWRIVGGAAPLKSFMITYAYYCGVLLVIIVLFMTIGEGVFKTTSPEVYAMAVSANPEQAFTDAGIDPFDDDGFLASQLILYLGIWIAGIWTWVGWGAYRELNGLTKTKSIIAFVLVVVLSMPVHLATYYIGQATS